VLHLFTQMGASEGGARELIDDLARTPLSEVVLFVAICTVVRLAVYPVLRKTPVHRRGAGFGLARFVNEALDAIIYAAVFVFMLIRPFVVQAFLIPTGSMVETLLVNDFIVANKAIYRYSDPQFQDIVVFRPPTRAARPNQIGPDGEVKVDFIKRCLGVPGDVIEIRDNQLYRNGEPVEEPYRKFTRTWDEVRFTRLTTEEMRMQARVDFKLVEFENNVIPLNIEGDYVNASGMIVAPDFIVTDMSLMQRLRELPPAPIPQGYYLMIGDNRNNSFDSRGWGMVHRDQIIGRSEVIWWPASRWGRTQ
jgi:signal peptidase I